MSSRRLSIYREYLRSFGIYYGSKMIVMDRWLAHFTKGRRPFRIKVSCVESPVYLRMNSTDADLASKLIGKQGGEYDFIKSLPGIENYQTIVDAGANVGFFTLLAKRAAPHARIISIEPDSGNYEMLCRNCPSAADSCTGGGDIKLHAGLWNKACKLGIEKRKTGDVGFVVYEDENGLIDAVSMPDIMTKMKIDHIDLLKMDIEGSEFQVFDESAEQWIDKVDVLIIETHERFQPGCEERVFSMMARHGFLHRRDGENNIFERRL